MSEAPQKLLTPGQVAKRFRVDPKTVSRWAEAGLLPCIREPGHHRRFRPEDVEKALADRTTVATPTPGR